MEITAIQSSPNALLYNNEARLEHANEMHELPPAPASALAVPVEMARAEVNQAAMLPQLMAPTRDGIFTIGPTSVKVSSALKITASQGTNSWGF